MSQSGECAREREREREAMCVCVCVCNDVGATYQFGFLALATFSLPCAPTFFPLANLLCRNTVRRQSAHTNASHPKSHRSAAHNTTIALHCPLSLALPHFVSLLCANSIISFALTLASFPSHHTPSTSRVSIPSLASK